MNYHDIPAISQTFLKAFDKSPAEAVAQYIDKTVDRDPPTASMCFGLNVERYWFDRESFVVSDIRKGVNLQKEKTIIGDDGHSDAFTIKRIITRFEKNELEKIVANIEGDKLAAARMAPASHGHVIRWIDEKTGLLCKCEIDNLWPDRIVDLKTAKEIDSQSFSRSAYVYGYNRQNSWYEEAVFQETGERLPMEFVVLKNSPPYDVQVFSLDEDFIELGRRQNRNSLAWYARCKETGIYRRPGQTKSLKVYAPYFARVDEEFMDDLMDIENETIGVKHES